MAVPFVPSEVIVIFLGVFFFVKDDERWMEKGSARPKGNKFGIRNVFGARTQTETFEINHLISRFLSLLPAYNQ